MLHVNMYLITTQMYRVQNWDINAMIGQKRWKSEFYERPENTFFYE